MTDKLYSWLQLAASEKVRYMNKNKRLSEAVTRLRDSGLVPAETLPECGLVVSVEARGPESVETVYDLDQGGRLVQEMVLPQKRLISIQVG